MWLVYNLCLTNVCVLCPSNICKQETLRPRTMIAIELPEWGFNNYLLD